MDKLSVLVFCIVSLLSGGCYSNQNLNSLDTQLILKEPNRVQFSISHPNGVVIQNIVFEKEHIRHKWLLQFKKNSGLKIYRQERQVEGENVGITLNEYNDILFTALKFIGEEFPESSVDQIHLDLNLIDETWKKIVVSVKEEAKLAPGVISHKNKKIKNAVVETLKSSTLMKESCGILREYLLDCDINLLSMNPVPFRTKYISKSWKTVLTLTHAGIDQEAWYGYDVLKDQ